MVLAKFLFKIRNGKGLRTAANPNASLPGVNVSPPSRHILRTSMTATDNLCLGMAAVYTFFGVTLFLAPDVCWGPDSPLSYWTEMDTSGVWFGRALGVWMTTITMSPYTIGVPKR